MSSQHSSTSVPLNTVYMHLRRTKHVCQAAHGQGPQFTYHILKVSVKGFNNVVDKLQCSQLILQNETQVH